MASYRLLLGSALFSLAVARSAPQEAATTVSADSDNAGFPLFEAERVQVNDEVLKAIRDSDSSSRSVKMNLMSGSSSA
ncbi:hypothetical protein PHISP_05704 [Aspergillus sp. HF37]|nr:hypothetical protein PHISP_05704 [Aspergillus sp. HF37]